MRDAREQDARTHTHTHTETHTHRTEEMSSTKASELMAVSLLLLAAALLASREVSAKCTAIGVGRNASFDGSVMLAHTDDAGDGTSDLRLVRVPSMDWPEGSKRPVYPVRNGYPRIVSASRGGEYAPRKNQVETEPLGFIPQVSHTYAYWDQDYGLMNEHQLAVAESTCGARTVAKPLGQDGGQALLDIGELSKIAMERCKTARCAIHLMGSLGVEHGFYAEAIREDSGEALILADALDELWVFHILPTPDGSSAVWAAQRVRDDHAVVIANDFVIQEMDLNDTDTFLFSDNMVDIAVAQGWYNSTTEETFNFFATFGFEKKKYDPVMGLYSGRRMWRVFSLINAEYSETADPYVGFTPSTCESYPFSLAPDEAISLEGLFAILSDHYEGTEFDLTRGLAAGPFGNPNRFEGHQKGTKRLPGGFERPISIYRGTFSFVTQSSSSLPDGVGVAWYGQDQPAGSVWVPVYASQTKVPAEFLWGKQSEFSRVSTWWAFNFVNNWMQLGYNKMLGDVQDARAKAQAEIFSVHEKIVAVAKRVPVKSLASYILTRGSSKIITELTDSWWSLSEKLIAKFSNGLITTGEEPGMRVGQGYPNWWLKAVGYTAWPPGPGPAVVTA